MSFNSLLIYLGIGAGSFTVSWIPTLLLGAFIMFCISKLTTSPQESNRNIAINTTSVPKTYCSRGQQTDNYTELKSATRVYKHNEYVEKTVVPSCGVKRLEDCLNIYKTHGSAALSDEDVLKLIDANYIQARNLEKELGDYTRAVVVRRKLLERKVNVTDALMYENYDYSKVFGACCENVIGYVGLPVGIAGPLLMDGKEYHVPMATTEGCLVASTNRGCRATSLSSGVKTSITFDGMSRGPVVRFPSAVRCCEALSWMNVESNLEALKKVFNSSSRFARLQSIQGRVAGRYLFIRFVASTGDAMGMNMVSKGTDLTLKTIQKHFADMEVLALSGNYCTDKKSAAINWLEGRGKSVVAEATIPARVVQDVLKTSVPAIVELNIAKNLVGSAMAGSIGGFNAHASNIVTAIFIATGQDPAQNVCSSSCVTLMEPAGPNGEDLYISCSMPSIEVGTVGGGTVLPSQSACLDILGLSGSNILEPGKNSRALASVICATVLAGELSLMSALAAGHLVKSHLKYNRSNSNIAVTVVPKLPIKPQVSSPSLLAPSKPHSRLPEVEPQITMNVIDLPTECKQS